ncbi:MAG: hypothetical protein DRP32_01595 [Thermotogae bacterium]|uniref:hypothetical protein n=1 Tax=Kosmotoga sp. TaxID=1955248 RepID=UPI000F1D1E5A|nr:hypothetical protein [Kosmotoga sp.]MBO8166391.1 hypothetical protein [Kosmotoga sp.]MCD6159285.1 hypothetical protein [Kosmotoga sp.]RKX50789.1 MAG: hypothetical protein DRP32_01595 [Thermotogota bacterium]
MFGDLMLLGIALVSYYFFIRWITLYLWHGKSVRKEIAEKAIKTFKKVENEAPAHEKLIIESKIHRIKEWASFHLSEHRKA